MHTTYYENKIHMNTGKSPDKAHKVNNTGAAEHVRQTQRPPDQCLDWGSIADPLLTGEKPAYRLYRFMPAWMSWSRQKRDLWRPENEQIWACWPHILGRHCLLSKIGTGLRALHLRVVPRGFETADGHFYLHACRVNWIRITTMPGLK